MKKLQTYIAILLLPVLPVCIDEYNPFSDLSNAIMVIESKSFTNGENISIFSAETLSVSPLIDDNIDSFSIHVDDNRLWSNGDTTIYNTGSLNTLYTFYISFYDTGYKYITVTTFRKDTLPHIEKYQVYAFSPLKQAPVNGYSGAIKGSIQLSTEPVADSDVLYHWNFGSGLIIKSSQNVLDTNILYSVPDSLGAVYVTDWNEQFQSPVSPFRFSILDTIFPTILCTNTDSMINDTIITGDSIFVFKTQIYDQDTIAVPVDSATVDGENFDIFYEKNRIYSKFFYNMQLYKDTATMVTVTAVDNPYFANTSRKTFWLRYDSTIQQIGGVEIVINHISDTTTTANPSYTISGRVINTTGETIILEAAVNGVPHSIKHTIACLDTGWYWTLSLNEGKNSVIISAKALNEAILTQKKVTIYHDPDFIDSIGPKIWQIFADNKLFTGQPVIVDTSEIEIRVIVFDEHSKIDSVTINGVIAERREMIKVIPLQLQLVTHLRTQK